MGIALGSNKGGGKQEGKRSYNIITLMKWVARGIMLVKRGFIDIANNQAITIYNVYGIL